MPRFVLLQHECPLGRPRPTHFDLMLESGDALATWTMSHLPSDWRSLVSRAASDSVSESNCVAAERLADHRPAYLDYEGPVSGDRGHVRRLDAGTFSALQEPMTYSLDGQFIRGTIKLERVSDDAQWQLVFTGR